MPAAKANSNGDKKTKKVAEKKAISPKLTKKVVPKKAVPKKKTVKKAAALKKVTKKVTKRKSISQSLPLKKTDEKTDKTRQVALEHLFKKAPPVTVVVKEKDNVSLPSQMSLRAIRKVESISELLNDEVAEKVRKGAYGLSFTFLLFGSFFTVQPIVQTALSNVINTAQLTGTASSTENAIKTTDALPSFTLLETIPEVLASESRFLFELRSFQSYEVVLLSFDDPAFKSILGTENVSEDKYRFIVPAAGLKPGEYKVKIIAKALNNLGVYEFTAGRFRIEQTQVNQATNVSTDPVLAETEADSTEIVTNTETSITPTEVVQETAEAETVEAPVTVSKNFSMYISEKLFTKSTVVYMQASAQVKDVVIYRKRENSLTPIIISRAELVSGTWRFIFDVSNTPNGVYDIFAKATLNTIPIESQPVRIKVEKPALTTTYSTEKQVVVTTASSTQTSNTAPTTVEEELIVSPPPRDFSELSLAPATAEATGSETEKIVTEFLRDRKSSLEILLRNYSVAVQSGDEIAIQLAKQALDNEQKLIIESNVGATSNLEKEVQLRFASLQSRIDTFEELRSSKNDGLTALDSDGDGISDFDERALFKTDPENPDTDEDGITDGIEIMRGYNPRSSSPEAVLIYESPKDSVGLTQERDLVIEKVSPRIVMPEVETENKIVQTEITGKGLPNSYVTLYIFSTPTVVTVKTDAAGSFTYVFEKELEDGLHEVYVAITDNAGEIIAQSNPFSFVKQAEAFTSGVTSENNSMADTYPLQNQYSITFGLAVLALGIILLMLGIGLRTSPITLAKKEVVT